MEVTCSSETTVDFQRTTRHYIITTDVRTCIFYLVGKMLEYEIGGAYTERLHEFLILVENLRKRDHLGEPDVEGRIIRRINTDATMWTKFTWLMAGTSCDAFVNTVMNARVPRRARTFSQTEPPLASQGLRSIE
jgi:hypothetical protein